MTRLNKKTLRRIKAEANYIRKIYESPNPEVDSIMENLRLERERFNEGVIGVCEKCGKEITEILDIQTWGGHTFCSECDKERLEELKKELGL